MLVKQTNTQRTLPGLEQHLEAPAASNAPRSQLLYKHTVKVKH